MYIYHVLTIQNIANRKFTVVSLEVFVETIENTYGSRLEFQDSMEDDFKCPNFLVSTGSALVVLVESKLFYELSPENRRGRVWWGSGKGGVG